MRTVRRDGSAMIGAARPLLAHMVVLNQNLFEIAPVEIHKAKIDMTVLCGKIVYASMRARQIEAAQR